MVRKAMALLAVLSLCTVFAYASGEKGKMDAAAYAAKLKAELNLTAEQTAKVESIYADFLKKMEPIEAKARPIKEELKTLRSASLPDQAAIKAKEGELEAVLADKKALVAERDKALKEVLTAEQFAKFQQLGEGGKKHAAPRK